MTDHTSPHEDGAPLLAESVSRQQRPVNLASEDAWLFAHEMERVLPATRLLELRDVRVSPEGLLFRAGRVLPESFAFDYLFEAWRGRRRRVAKFLVLNYLIRRCNRLASDAAWIVDDWSHGYFHWLADALPRLFLIRDRFYEWTLLLPNRYRELGFVEPSLLALGARRFQYMDAAEVLRCRRLFLPTHVAPSGHYHGEVIRSVRELLVQAYGDVCGDGRRDRLYISRGGARRRRIANEEEVLQVLCRFGFQVIRAESCSFPEQVRLACRARYLVSNHGAGLTNMLFMAPGSSVLELRHTADSVNNCYFTLASPLGLRYFYQTCEPVVPCEDPHTANLLVDVRRLEKSLGQMLAVTAGHGDVV